MKYKLMPIFVLSIVLSFTCFAATTVPVVQPNSATISDIQKVVREENTKTLEQVDKKIADATTSFTQKTYDFANKVMGDFVKVVEDAEKRVVLIAGLTIGGSIIFIEGFLGFIRIRKESNLLNIMRKNLDEQKKQVENLTKTMDELKNVFTLAVQDEVNKRVDIKEELVPPKFEEKKKFSFFKRKEKLVNQKQESKSNINSMSEVENDLKMAKDFGEYMKLKYGAKDATK